MDVTQEVRAALQSDLPLAERFAEARNIIDDAMRGQPHPSDFASVLDGTLGMLEQMQCALLTQDSVIGDINRLGQVAKHDISMGLTQVVQIATAQPDVSPQEVELPWLRIAGGAADCRRASVLQGTQWAGSRPSA
jgi:hypothetical protein